ncbi:hypothetical protein KIS1582_5149 [Cytobacillus firmus]|uniref:Uncharacterized protein n=1 Tax=Cytobacillus firmus TaxID=1399 RepID=A0A800N848_CYTFI|nr:hypothetical protein KIS1582_5149 [Cytobacillus firmus]
MRIKFAQRFAGFLPKMNSKNKNDKNKVCLNIVGRSPY